MNLNHVTVRSSDVARAVAFYRGLGLELIVDSIPRYARLVCPDGEATFSIHHAEHGERAERAEHPDDTDVVVYFECDDLDARVAQLAAAGLRFDSGPIDQPWLWREARLRDPDGRVVCLFHAGANRRDPPWKVRGPDA